MNPCCALSAIARQLEPEWLREDDYRDAGKMTPTMAEVPATVDQSIGWDRRELFYQVSTFRPSIREKCWVFRVTRV